MERARENRLCAGSKRLFDICAGHGLYAHAPGVQAVFRENYSAQVSGVDPTLDWININQKTAYIQNTITTRKKWSFGISVGPGVLYDGSIHGGIGAVAGLQYNF